MERNPDAYGETSGGVTRGRRSAANEVDRWLAETKFIPPKGGEFVVHAVESFASAGKKPTSSEIKARDDAVDATYERMRDESDEERQVRVDFEDAFLSELAKTNDARKLVEFIVEHRKRRISHG
jgi:hypothetical protein